MQRHLEPELMDNSEHALAFHRANKDYGIRGFLDLYNKYINLQEGKIIDLGTGSGEYLLALEHKYPKLIITGFDGSEPMVHIARGLVETHSSSIRVRHRAFKDIDATADCVISTNTLHHMHDPSVFWNCVKKVAPKVFVMDLVRPANITIARSIVDTLATNESDEFKIDYYNSLLAAFSPEELQEQINGTKLQLTVEGDSNSLQVAVIHGILQ
jgi:2-polyprenyl-3-methyl-5-hydroxy-6-metoxy-1,4-benzoquinol methylase